MNTIIDKFKSYLAIIFSFLVLTVYNVAFSTSLPKGCEHKGYEFNDPFLILNQTGEQTFYLIENISDNKIELQKHETDDVFMSPPLIAILEKKTLGSICVRC